MSFRQSVARWCVVSLAAYAMVFHALLMGIASAPHTSAENALVAALQEICTGMVGGEAQPSEPASSKVHSAPCALCGLGHAVLDAPQPMRVPLPLNILETVAQAPDSQPVYAWLDLFDHARPRAPPAFA
jgi:hypothetical protein